MASEQVCKFSKADCKFAKAGKCRHVLHLGETPAVLKDKGKTKKIEKVVAFVEEKPQQQKQVLEEMVKMEKKQVNAIESILRRIDRLESKGATVKAADAGVVLTPTAASPIVNGYMATLLDPRISGQSIPDSVLVPHITKNIKSAVNVLVPPTILEGMFVFYLNNSKKLIGFHYPRTASGWGYDANGSFKLSQDIDQNYDYSRKVSMMVTGSSTTLAAGTYALSGTFNLLYAQTTVSELGNLSYATLPGQVANAQDKVVNVPVNTGFVAIASPMMDQPFARINDQTPVNAIIGTVNDATIFDSNQDLVYSMRASLYSGGVNNNTYIFGAYYNADIVDFSVLTIDVAIFGSNPVASGQILITGFYTATGLLGNTMVRRNFGIISTSCTANQPWQVEQTFQKVASEFETLTDVGVNGPYSIDKEGGITNIKIELFYYGPNFTCAPASNISVLHRVAKAAQPGFCNNVTLVAYQNVAAGSTISLEATTNFEMIPNANLRPDLEVKPAEYEPAAVEYVKKIWSMKERLGIANVYAADQYQKMLPTFSELAVVSMHSATAKAAGWGDVVGKVKEAALPMLKSFFPEAGPLVALAEMIGNRVRPNIKAASGNVRACIKQPGCIAKASSSKPVMKRLERVKRAEKPLVELFDRAGARVVTTCATRFPVVQTRPNVQGEDQFICCNTYVAVKGNYCKLTDKPTVFVKAGPNGVVYGWEGVKGFKTTLELHGEYTLLPATTTSGGLELAEGYMVTERSCELALALCEMEITHTDTYFTGAVAKDGVTLEPIGAEEEKRAYVESIGSTLVVACEDGVDTVYQAISASGTMARRKPNLKRKGATVKAAPGKASQGEKARQEFVELKKLTVKPFIPGNSSVEVIKMNNAHQLKYKRDPHISTQQFGDCGLIYCDALCGSIAVYYGVNDEVRDHRSAKHALAVHMINFMEAKAAEPVGRMGTAQLQLNDIVYDAVYDEPQTIMQLSSKLRIPFVEISKAVESMKGIVKLKDGVVKVVKGSDIISQYQLLQPIITQNSMAMGVVVLYDATLNDKAITNYPLNVLCCGFVNCLQHATNNVFLYSENTSGPMSTMTALAMYMHQSGDLLGRAVYIVTEQMELAENLEMMLQQLHYSVVITDKLP